MTTIAVKHYNFGMQGAPQLANAWGDMTALLDAVLVDGFNLRTIDTLTFAAGIATARVNAARNKLPMTSTRILFIAAPAKGQSSIATPACSRR